MEILRTIKAAGADNKKLLSICMAEQSLTVAAAPLGLARPLNRSQTINAVSETQMRNRHSRVHEEAVLLIQ